MSADPISNNMNNTGMKRVRVVPWYNKAQFKKTYEYLFSTELVKKRWAVDQISVWETRCHPSLAKCHPAIEASVVIVRAIIQDILLTNGASLCQEHDIQNMYSMALIRFVTLTIEPHQNNQPFLGTTAQIAKGLGIPSWIVDLRNEAVHSYLPSLPSLRMAAEEAMKYLKESFWEKEIKTLKNLVKKPPDEKDIRELIYTYITLRFDILKSKGERKTGQCKQDFKKIKPLLDKLASHVQRNKRHFIKILISGGLFIPYDDELKSVMSPTECVKYEATFDEAYENRSMPPGELSLPPVPVELEKLWKQMLYMLNMTRAIPELLEELFKSLPERSEMGKKLIFAWAIKIIDCKGCMKKIFRKQGLLANWHRLFNAALSHPCIYTPYIFCRLYSRLNLKKRTVRYILQLLSIAIGHASGDSVELPDNCPVYTVDDLKEMKKLQKAKKEKSEKSGKENIWSVCEDPSYESWPIGLVINPVDDSDKAENQPDDFIPLEYFEQKVYTEKYFIRNENDNEEEEFVANQPSSSEDEEMEISEGQTFLYKMK